MQTSQGWRTTHRQLKSPWPPAQGLSWTRSVGENSVIVDPEHTTPQRQGYLHHLVSLLDLNGLAWRRGGSIKVAIEVSPQIVAKTCAF
jgi:hypothetical protein